MRIDGYPVTEKFECEKCGYKLMYPNKINDRIRGFKCANCHAANYPTRSKLDNEKKTNEVRKIAKI